jgi:hypothetical protein
MRGNANLEKDNLLAIDAAENEGLHVVGLSDEKSPLDEVESSIPVQLAAANGFPLLRATDASKRKLMQLVERNRTRWR